MPWQDPLFALGGVVSIWSLVDALLNKKTAWPLRSSLMKTGMQAAYAIGNASLGFWLATGTSTIATVLWLAMAVWRRPASSSGRGSES